MGGQWVSGKPESRAVTGGLRGRTGGSSSRPPPWARHAWGRELTARVPRCRVTVRAPSLPSGPQDSSSPRGSAGPVPRPCPHDRHQSPAQPQLQGSHAGRQAMQGPPCSLPPPGETALIPFTAAAPRRRGRQTAAPRRVGLGAEGGCSWESRGCSRGPRRSTFHRI